MKKLLPLLIFAIPFCCGRVFVPSHERHNSLLSSVISLHTNSFNNLKNGTTYSFRSILDGSAITVLGDGEVICQDWDETPEQKWTAVNHPTDKGFFELKQDVVPYNMLSGFKDSDINPGLFPRPLTFSKVNDKLWEIRIRQRWCLQAHGRNWRLDIDDCEYEYDYAPWQLWEISEIAESD